MTGNDKFTFNIRRRTQYIRRFSIPKTSALDLILGKGPKLKGEKKEEKKKETPQSFGNLIKRLLIIGVIFILLLFGFAALLMFSHKPTVSFTEPDVSLVYPPGSAKFINYGEELESIKDMLTVFINYNVDGATVGNLTVDVYGSFETKDVYFVKTRVYTPRSNNYLEFKTRLKDLLLSNGYNFKEIDVDEVDEVKNSVLIIPSGLLPVELSDDLVNLTHDNIVIYIGYPFTTVLSQNQLLSNPYCDGDTCYNFTFVKRGDRRFHSVCSGLNLHDPAYSVQKTSVNSYPVGLVDGCLPIIHIDGGSLILFPQYLDDGWDSGDAAAEDVFRFIDGSWWHGVLYHTEYDLRTLGWNNSKTLFIGPLTEPVDDVYFKLKLRAANPKYLVQKVVVGHAVKDTYGSLAVSPMFAVPYKFSKQPVNLYIILKEPGNKTTVTPRAVLYKDGKMVDEFNLRPMQSNFDYPVWERINIDEPGSFVVTVEDDRKVYCRGYLHVSDIVIVDKNDDYIELKKGLVRYEFRDELGNPITVSSVSVYMDGRSVGQFKDTSRLEFTIPSLAPGKHRVRFDFGDGVVREQVLDYNPPNPILNIFNNTLNRILLLITIVSVVIALTIKRREIPMYHLDIPDFPPMAFKKLYVKADKVKEIFNKINQDYSWVYMPLSFDEVRSGFVRYLKRGKEVIIGDYNLQEILDKLISKGVVQEKDGYYVLTDWLEKSGHSLKYLYIYRKLRDIFIDNVVSFTKLDASKVADVEMSFAGEKNYIIIYDGDVKRVVDKIIKNNLSNVIIVFENEKDKRRFMQEISTDSITTSWLRVNIGTDNIKLFTLDELDGYIKTRKGI